MGEDRPFDLLSSIIAYEDGSMSSDEVVKFFQYLVNSGDAWSLQGHYGRVAKSLIQAGLVKPKE